MSTWLSVLGYGLVRAMARAKVKAKHVQLVISRCDDGCPEHGPVSSQGQKARHGLWALHWLMPGAAHGTQEDRAAMRVAMDAVHEQPARMGGEQLDSKSHFKGLSMELAADSPYDAVYSMAHAGLDTKSHFGAGMLLSDTADAGLAFDRVYGSQHEQARADTAFTSGFQLKKGYSVP